MSLSSAAYLREWSRRRKGGLAGQLWDAHVFHTRQCRQRDTSNLRRSVSQKGDKIKWRDHRIEKHLALVCWIAERNKLEIVRNRSSFSEGTSPEFLARWHRVMDLIARAKSRSVDSL
jgi:hypothetical protein